MTDEKEWPVIFFVEESGISPIREFLRSLDKKTKVRFGWSIDQLQIRNLQAGPPLVKHLEGKIWELREESDTNIYRLLYALAPRHRIVFLHGFQKKTQKTPPDEIKVAKRRLEIFIKREEGEI